MNKKGNNTQKNQRIQVFARCRPLNSIERNQGSPSIVEVIKEKKEIVVKDRNIKKEFFFDKVFPHDTNQIEVYKTVVEPLIQEVLMGYNCTVFAYGQTGTGKTHTMEGKRINSKCSWEDDPGAGIIPRSLHQLFEELNKGENVEFSVRVSFLELYNEQLFDLLGSDDFNKHKLGIYEDSVKKGSVIIQGLEEIPVNSKDEVYSILERGSARRQTAATLYNDSSSRSHTVFSVTIHIKENTVEGEELLKTGKLNLVDLAGSENVGRSGANNIRLREASNINQSLLTLGRVITSLIEKQPHVPYRESKLTRILQDSLGGHTKTSIIATISPAQLNLDETLSTLDYATKAKSITIKPEANQKMTKRALIREYTDEIERLRKDLIASRSNDGFYVDHDNYNSMLKEIEIGQEERKELQETKCKLLEENELKEQTMAVMKEEIDKITELFTETRNKLYQTKEDLTFTKKVLSKTALERDETEHLLNVHCSTEKKLTQQAQALLEVADQTTNDVDKLHAKIERKENVEKTNDERAETFKTVYQKQFAHLDDIVTEMKSQQCEKLTYIGETLSQVSTDINQFKQKCSLILHSIFSCQESNMQVLSSHLGEEVTMQSHFTDTTLRDLNYKKQSISTNQQSFLEEKFPKLVCHLSTLLEEVENLVVNKQEDIQKKIKDLQVMIKANSEQKHSLISNIQTNLNLFHEHHENLLKELKESQQSQCSLLEEDNKHFNQFMANMYQNLTEYQNSRQYFLEEHKKVSDKQSSVHSSHNAAKFVDTYKCVENLKVVEDPTKELTALSDISAACKINEFILKQELTKGTLKSLASSVTESFQHNNKEQEQALGEAENAITDITSKFTTNYEKASLQLKENIASLSTDVNKENSSIQVNEDNLQIKILQVEHKVVDSKVHVNVFTDKIKKEIIQRDLEIEKFLCEDLQKDIPTGTTPQRKFYEYPKQLVATSPDEHILRRLRTIRESNTNIAINLPLDSSFDDSDEFKSPLNLETTQSTVVNTSFNDEDDYFSGCDTESNASSMSDLSVDSLKNKENWKKPSHLPKFKRSNKKQTKTEVTKIQPVGRKPLTSQN